MLTIQQTNIVLFALNVAQQALEPKSKEHRRTAENSLDFDQTKVLHEQISACYEQNISDFKKLAYDLQLWLQKEQQKMEE